MVAANRTITKLNIRGTLIRNEELNALTKAISTNTTLVELILNDVLARQEPVQAFCVALKSHPSLRNLTFAGNNIGDAATDLSDVIRKNKVLRTVNIDGSKELTRVGKKILLFSLAANPPLRSFSMCDVTLESELGPEVTKVLKANTNLEEFHLRKNGLYGKSSPPDLIESLITLFVTSPSLLVLDADLPDPMGKLFTKNLENRQLTEFPTKLLKMGHLQSLNLSNNFLTFLPSEMSLLTELRELDISNNRLLTLPPSMGFLTNLKTLKYANNAFKTPPPEVLSKGNVKLILGYLRDLAKGAEPVYRIKLMMVGQENVGKTTILRHIKRRRMRRALKKTPIKPTISTDGIDIDEWQLEVPLDDDKDVTLGGTTSAFSSSGTGSDSHQRSTVERISATALMAQQQAAAAAAANSNSTSTPPASSVLPSSAASSPAFASPLAASAISSSSANPSPSSSASNLDQHRGSTGSGNSGAMHSSSSGSSLSHASSSQGPPTGIHRTLTRNLTIGNNASTFNQRVSTDPDANKKFVTVSSWDFAGQEIYYTTHQFFLSQRSLYLLVWDLRYEDEECKVSYWLQSIRSRTNNSPVIIIGTHADEFGTHEEATAKADRVRKKYQKRFPFIKYSLAVSAKTGSDIDLLVQKIREVIRVQDHMGELIPKTYMEMERLVRTECIAVKEGRAPYPPLRSWTDIQKLGSYCYIADDEELRRCVHLLHDFGSLIYFDDPSLGVQDLVIIDSQFLTNVMATIITTKTSIRDGLLPNSLLPMIWRPPEFPPEIHEILLSLLKKFEIAFSMPAALRAKFSSNSSSSRNANLKSVLSLSSPNLPGGGANPSQSTVANGLPASGSVGSTSSGALPITSLLLPAATLSIPGSADVSPVASSRTSVSVSLKSLNEANGGDAPSAGSTPAPSPRASVALPTTPLLSPANIPHFQSSGASSAGANPAALGGNGGNGASSASSAPVFSTSSPLLPPAASLLAAPALGAAPASGSTPANSNSSNSSTPSSSLPAPHIGASPSLPGSGSSIGGSSTTLPAPTSLALPISGLTANTLPPPSLLQVLGLPTHNPLLLSTTSLSSGTASLDSSSASVPSSPHLSVNPSSNASTAASSPGVSAPTTSAFLLPPAQLLAMPGSSANTSATLLNPGLPISAHGPSHGNANQHAVAASQQQAAALAAMAEENQQLETLIPSLLPEERPDCDLVWRPVDASKTQYDRQYQLEFVPKGLFSRLLIRILHHVDSILVYWRYGVIAEKGRDIFFVELRPHEAVLVVSVRGPKSSPPVDTFRMCIETIDLLIGLNNWFNIKVNKFVPCAHCIDAGRDSQWMFKLGDLEERAVSGVWTVDCEAPLPSGSRNSNDPLARTMHLTRLVPDMAMSDLERSKIPHEELTMHEEIGKGAFGIIHRATYKGRDVAVKVMVAASQEGAKLKAFNEFRREVHVMSGMRHPSLVNMVGFCVNPFALVMELMPSGNLYKFLHRSKGEVAEAGATAGDDNDAGKLNMDASPSSTSKTPRKNSGDDKSSSQNSNESAPSQGTPVATNASDPSSSNNSSVSGDLPDIGWPLRLKIALDIALGMNYLHSATPPFIHRDLKSPNVLLLSTDFRAEQCAKVGDFGLSSRMYVPAYKEKSVSRDVANPTWLAPEIIREEEFDVSSDVYSYGIILWELLVRKHPYAEYRTQFMFELEDIIKRGTRPTIPADCPSEYAALITRCVSDHPDERPAFFDVIKLLVSMAADLAPELRIPDDIFAKVRQVSQYRVPGSGSGSGGMANGHASGHSSGNTGHGGGASSSSSSAAGGGTKTARSSFGSSASGRPSDADSMAGGDDESGVESNPGGYSSSTAGADSGTNTVLTGQFLKQMTTNPLQKIYSMALVSDDQMWCGTRDGSILIWNTRNGHLLAKHDKIHTSAVTSLFVAGNYIWTHAWGEKARVWKTLDEAAVQQHSLTRETSLEGWLTHKTTGITRKLKRRFCTIATKRFYVYKAEGDKVPAVMMDLDGAKVTIDQKAKNPTFTVTPGKSTREAKAVVIQAKDKQELSEWVSALEAEINRHEQRFDISLVTEVDCVDMRCFLVMDGLVWGGSRELRLKVWDPDRFQLLKNVELDLSSQLASLAADTSSHHEEESRDILNASLLFISAISEYDNRIWLGVQKYLVCIDKESLLPIRLLPSHSLTINTIIGYDGRVWTASDDATVKVWDAFSYDCLQTFSEVGGKQFVLIRAGSQIWTAGWDGVIRVFNGKTAQLLRALDLKHQDAISAFTISYGSLWAASWDGTISIWG